MTSSTPNPYHARRSSEARPAPPRRSRALLPLGVAAWALVEIWLLTLLGRAAGGLAVFLVLLAGLVVGALVIKTAGRRAWRRLSATLQPGASPRAVPEAKGGNALAMLGGLLLMVPGLLSDAVGLACLFPPTAALIRAGAAHFLSRGSLGAALAEARTASEQARMRREGGTVVQGEVVREDGEPGGRESAGGEDVGRGPEDSGPEGPQGDGTPRA